MRKLGGQASRVRCIGVAALVLGTCLGSAAAQTTPFDPTSPAVQQAYVGPATPEKVSAALTGLNSLINQVQVLQPPGFCVGGCSGSVSISAGGGPLLDLHYLLGAGSLLQAASDADLGAPAAGVTLDHTTLRTLASFTTGRDFHVGPGYGAIDTNGFNLAISGTVTAEGPLIKLGVGTLTLTGSNLWGVAPEVDAGTLRGNTVSLNSPIHDFATVEFDQPADGIYPHVISQSGGVNKTGAGTLTFTQAQTYSGPTNILGGTFALLGAGAIDGTSNLSVAAGAAFDLSGANGARTVGALAGSGAIQLGSNLLITSTNADSTFGGVLSGVGGLTKTGTGTLTLTGANTYSGETAMFGGTLALSGAGQINPGTALHVWGGTFDISGADGSREIGSLMGLTSTVSLGPNTLTVGRDNTDTSFSGAIMGAGGLTKVGAGTLTLDGQNTYTGLTTISQGVLAARSFSLSDTVLNNATLTLYRNRSGTPAIDVYSGAISGTGRLVKDGDDYIWLRGTNSYTGGTLVKSGVLIGNTDSLPGNITNNAGLAFYQVRDGTYTGTLDGPGTLFAYGPGTLTLTGQNTYTGGTVFSTTVQVASDANLGAPSGGLLMDGGTLRAAGDLAMARPVTLGPTGGRFDTQGFGITLGGIVGGPGSLTKEGSGTLTLTAANTYTGPTIINAGRFAVEGSIASPVTVAAGGELGGTGTIGGDVVNYGRIARGGSPGALTVAGNVTFAPGSVFTVKADASGNSDRLVLTGAAARAKLQGGTVDVQAVPGAYGPVTRYTILTAPGGVTGSFTEVRSNFAFLTPTLAADASNIFLTLARNDVRLDGIAQTGNQLALGQLLTGIEGRAGGDMALVLQQFMTLSPADARAALDAIAGAERAGLAQVLGLAQRSMDQTVISRLGALDAQGGFHAGSGGTGAALAGAPSSSIGRLYAAIPGVLATDVGGSASDSRHGIWVRGFGGQGYVKDTGGNAGFRYDVAGVIGGYDFALTPRLTLGALGSYAEPTLDQNDASSHTEAQSYQLGLYGRYRANAVHVDGILSGALTNTGASRSVAVGGLARTAHASYPGSTIHAYAEAGYTFAGSIEVTPLVGLHWVRQTQDGYTETGADALNLIVPSRTVDSVRSTLGAQMRYPFEWSGIRLGLEGRAGWAHEWNGDGALRAQLAGDPTAATFFVSGVPLPRDSALLGIGLTAEPWQNLCVYADANAEVNGVQQAWGASAGLRYQW